MSLVSRFDISTMFRRHSHRTGLAGLKSGITRCGDVIIGQTSRATGWRVSEFVNRNAHTREYLAENNGSV